MGALDDDFLEYVPPSGVASPCVNICQIDPATRLCLGCRRTIDEIARWGSTTDDDRRAILDALAARQA
jgi:predicted Fe-S protein YdhL (DUF1289 family)